MFQLLASYVYFLKFGVFYNRVSRSTTRHWSQYGAEEGKPYSFDPPATSSSPKFWDGGQAPLHPSSEYLLNVWLRIAMVHVHQFLGRTRGTEGRVAAE